MTDWGDEEYAGATLAGEAGPDSADTDPLDDSTSDDEPSLYYGSVDEFLREYLRSLYRRAVNGRSRVWAARWWEHPEASSVRRRMARLGSPTPGPDHRDQRVVA